MFQDRRFLKGFLLYVPREIYQNNKTEQNNQPVTFGLRIAHWLVSQINTLTSGK